MLGDKLPPDPFGPDPTPDLTQWGSNCRSMYTSLVAAGFKDEEALEFTIRIMCAIMLKAVK
ncbi:MAG TPA: hypothetical protein VGR89_16335 [Puia sp.]|nr:hypothetical protein [Puia sp.]